MMKKNKNTFATKQDIEELKIDFKKELNRFATKDDLKAFATKDDLKKFATKDDLKRFATKKDLKKYATKLDLNKMTDALAVQIVEINNQTRKDIKNDILSFQDKILHEIVKLRDDNEMIIGQRQKVEDHEERILRLENGAAA